MKKLILHGGVERRQTAGIDAGRRQSVGAIGTQHGGRQAEQAGQHQPMSMDLHPTLLALQGAQRVAEVASIKRLI
ncbi:hypothetical protein D3C87_1991040 [compost metagenome]